MPSSLASATTTLAAHDTEETLPLGGAGPLDWTSTSANLVFEIDIAALTAGQTLEIKVKKNTLTSGTIRQMYTAIYGPTVYASPIVATVPVAFVADTSGSPDCSYRVTLKQAGTPTTMRAFPWRLIDVQ